MIGLETGTVPIRVFKGVYEITRFIHEIIGFPNAKDFNDIPDTIRVPAIQIAMEKPVMSFVVFSGDPSENNSPQVNLTVLSRDTKNPIVRLGFTDQVEGPGKIAGSMLINVLRDIRRIEEFEHTIEVGVETVPVKIAVAHTENMRISFLIQNIPTPTP